MITTTFTDDIDGDDIEYVTLEECCLLADDNRIPDGRNLLPNEITTYNNVQNPTTHNGECQRVVVQPLFAQTG